MGRHSTLEMVGRNKRMKTENTKKTIRGRLIFKNEVMVTNTIQKQLVFAWKTYSKKRLCDQNEKAAM